MSQSTTLFRLSKDKFSELENSGGNSFEPSWAKNYITLQGSFMALEFILSKDQDDSTIEQIQELFSPSQQIGGQNIGIDDLDSFEEFDFDETPISYLDAATIGGIHNTLDKISTAEIESLYDADELNSNGIYPEVWQDGDSKDQAFNFRHVSDDFAELKSIIKKAAEEGDYIVVFEG